MRKLHVKEEALKEAIQLIQALNPHQVMIWLVICTEYIVPDVFVKKKARSLGGGVESRHCT